MFLLVIVVGLAITLGAGPDGYLHTGEYWTSLPAFKNGFSVCSTIGLMSEHALTK